MIAEVISIGDELTSGQRLDTNSQWVSQQLGDLGVRVLYHSTVGDELEAGSRVFRQAIERAQIVVATGGLGPTADDLTRESIAAAAGLELDENADALDSIVALFARRQRPMPERNRLQARFPRGSRVIANPNGTAPGIDLIVPRGQQAPCRIFALPGVPAEMREMWAASVAPAILSMLRRPRAIRHRRIKCFGVGESDLEQMLPDLIRRGRTPQVGITVHGATITLRITAEGESGEACLAAMQPTLATIHEHLGNLVFGEEDDELEHAVVRLLRQQQATLATCEWGTGGLIAHLLSEVPRSADCVRGGLIVRDEAALATLIGQHGQHVDGSGRDEPARVVAMAEACRRQLQTDYGLAVGPLPGEAAGGAAGGEADRLHFAVAAPQGLRGRSAPYLGHPEILKPRGAKQALNLLRLLLLHAEP